MTVTVKYLPDAWLDEVIPSPQLHPNDFIHRHDGSFFVWPKDGPEEDREIWGFEVSDGETVLFCELRDFGEFEIRVDRDDSGRLVFHGHEQMPEEADWFCVSDDPNIVGTCLEEILEWEGPGTYTVSTYHWTDGRPWRFDASTARFVQETLH